MEYWLLYVTQLLCHKYELFFDDSLLDKYPLTNNRNYKKIRSRINKLIRLSDPHQVALSLISLTDNLSNKVLVDIATAVYGSICMNVPIEETTTSWSVVKSDLSFIITGKRND